MKINLLIALIVLVIVFTGCKQKFYRASSSSMEKTLMTGQQFMMTKTKEFNRNDLVVFNYYGNDYTKPSKTEAGQWEQHWEKRVYRLIAYSGDTLLIKNGEVYVNGKLESFPATAMMSYEITSEDAIPELQEAAPMNVNMIPSGSFIKYEVPLTKEEAEHYSHMKGVKDVIKIFQNHERQSQWLAVPAGNLNWTIDNYGPLRIPKAGETIIVDSLNFNLYKNIPGIQRGRHILKENLFFVMGDNRHRAEDSRYTGFISYSNMYGVVNK